MEAPSTETDGSEADETAPTHQRRWRPGLDGMRAIAVLAVMAYHEPNLGLRGGFLGVDLFFVLSGFLITGLLLDEHERHGSISLRAFWDRRARRLLAGLALLLALVVIAATILSDDAARRAMPQSIGAAALYVSNWQLIANGVSYFDQFRSLSPFQHLWSVAIEEQFYLVWPIVILLCLRWRRSAAVVVTIVVATISVVLMGVLATSPDPSRAYFGTDTRVFALLVGALGALLAWNIHARGRRASIIGAVSLALIVLALCVVGDTDLTMYRGGFLLFALLALALTIVASGDNVITTALSHPWLRRIGEFSYALYLWHWPVRVFATDSKLPFADDAWGNLAALLTRLALTVALAVSSTLLVERLIRRSRLGLSILGPAWLGVGALAILLAVVWLPDSGSRIVGLDATASPKASIEQAANAPGRILLIGDSMAMTLVDGMIKEVPAGVSVTGAGRIGCALLVSDRMKGRDNTWSTGATGCPDRVAEWTSLAEDLHPSVVLVLTGAWDIYARDWGDGPRVPGDPDFDARYREQIDATIDLFASRGAEVVFLATPCFGAPPGSERNDGQQPARSQALAAVQRAAVTSANRRAPGTAAIIGLDAISCEGGFTKVFDGVEWRPDGTHFSVDGARVASRWILGALPADARRRLAVPAN